MNDDNDLKAGTLPVNPDQPDPTAAATTAKAMVDQARRLGLTWTLRAATVQDAEIPAVIYDGDTKAIGATSMIGALATNQRVYCIMVPPSGNFVVGIVGGIKAPGKGLVARVDAIANTAAISAEAVVLTSPSFEAETGRAYGVIVTYAIIPSVANASGGNLRLTNLAGSVIVAWGEANPNTSAGPQFTHIQRFKKTTSTSRIVVVQTALSSAGNITMLGSATQPRFLEIWDIGAASDYAGAPAI